MKDNKSKDGKIRVGFRWMDEEEAQQFIHPKEYDPSFKEICRMHKKHSPYFCVFQVDPMDDGDEWFIMVSKVRKKTKAIGSSHTIIKKDVGVFIRALKSMEGYDEEIWSEHYQTEESRKLFNLK